nr:Spy/CpxP family protein refolding chaperone [uncultured Massilia sp.]
MKFIRRPVAAALLAASFFASFTACAATSSVAPEPGADMVDTADVPPGGPGPDDRGPGPGFRGPGLGMPFGHFHGLKLTDAQQDKLFNIMHAQAPQRREHEKAIRKAEEGLRELGGAERFDDARAAALTRDLGQAIAAAELLRVRTQSQALAVLTPEQRAEWRERRRHGPGRDGGPHDGPDGAPRDSK